MITEKKITEQKEVFESYYAEMMSEKNLRAYVNREIAKANGKTDTCDSCGEPESECHCGDFVSTRPVTDQDKKRLQEARDAIDQPPLFGADGEQNPYCKSDK